MTLKARWQNLKKGRPGRRFQDRYAAGHQARNDVRWGPRALRLFRLMVALGAIVVGLFLTVLPGPAILFFFIAGGLLAAESRAIARLLDWGEVKLRAGGSSAEKRWRRLAVGQKIAVTGLIASLGVALAYASYRVLL